MLYITRKFHFSASHKVSNPAWSDEENMRVYGKCANPNGHGHNYILEVTVAGETDPAIGYVMDLKELNELVENILINNIDHKNLNADVDFLKGVNPTTENIIMQFWKQIDSKIKNKNRKLHSLKLFETEKNAVEYKG
jgi:6-pyruvoyltetrahydropterin/6-carboxytetrahydropterin synthase